jgi:tetratricopeptide (TPR) repeat protein
MDAQVRIAMLRAQGGEVARAREIVQQLRDQSPDDAQMLFLVEAEILDEVGRSDDAMAVYGEALKAFPDDQDLLYGRAMYAVKLNRTGPAEEDFKRIIAANPEHADALNALGYTLADRTDRYREALGYIERAHKLKPEEPAILDSMGWVSFKLGSSEVALGYLRQALKAMNDGEIAAHLGEVLWALGRHDDAWGVWNAALKDFPDHAYLNAVVARHRVTQNEHVK